MKWIVEGFSFDGKRGGNPCKWGTYCMCNGGRYTCKKVYRKGGKNKKKKKKNGKD